MIRVLIADDQKLVRQGLHVLLSRADDVQVVGEARDGQEAVDLAQRLAPDIVLMDVRMPRLDGLAATRMIAAPSSKTRVLMVAMQCDQHTVRQAIQNGAKGFIAKAEMYSELAAALRVIVEGGVYFSPSVAKLLSVAELGPTTEKEVVDSVEPALPN